uniref:Putative secreted peptide n=1 Tax=Anopheles braziliensis TaxID=58242 RepID=A0A2M3ZXD9_9DIPT
MRCRRWSAATRVRAIGCYILEEMLLGLIFTDTQAHRPTGRPRGVAWSVKPPKTDVIIWQGRAVQKLSL